MRRPSKSQLCAGNGSGRNQPTAKRKAALASTRVAAADLMGVGDQLAIPRLDGVPLEHRFSAGELASITLAQTLLELDIAIAEDWVAAGHDPRAYILKTLDCWIAAHGGESIKRRFDLYVTLTDCLDGYVEGNEDNPDGSRLYLTIDADKAGYVVFKPTLELLDQTHPRAPATFFQLFAGALNNWVRVYDYRDAQDRVATLCDWIEGEEDQDQYEIPNVEGSIPPYMNRRQIGRRGLRKVAYQAKKKQVRAILTALLELSEISDQAKRPELTDEMREELCDTNPALPSLLAVFAQNDAIEGCFDEEAQNMMEVTPEPSVIIPLNALDRESVLYAFRTLGVVCETLAAASKLIDIMPGNEQGVIKREEAGNGGPSQDRE
ncbi:MAG TPA: hypothetical protein VKV95_17475 [Terriglobia bacterium]|nr:hypothetical protein [Terriglobia bacterium]